MDSAALPLPADAAWPAAEEWRHAHLALAFLPPSPHLEATLERLATQFPDALVAGCEAVTQFRDGGLAEGGVVHLFRFRHGGGATAEILHAEGATRPAAVRHLVEHLDHGGPALLFADGLHCPAEDLLAELRHALAMDHGSAGGSGADAASATGAMARAVTATSGGDAGPPLLAGGLASQEETSEDPGARAFLAGTVVAGGAVAVLLSGIDAEVEVVRGWEPASPVFEVTHAEGRVLHEIGGEPAADWFRRLFTVPSEGDDPAGSLLQMSHRFPLIVTGPAADRRGLYRSMRDFDQPTGAVTFWGELETGDRVRLGIGNEVSLVDRADRLVGGTAEAAVFFSCLGRQQVLGEAAGREVEAVHRALGGVPLSGLFSFGEVGPTPAGGPAFYNHTAILVRLRERPREAPR